MGVFGGSGKGNLIQYDRIHNQWHDLDLPLMSFSCTGTTSLFLDNVTNDVYLVGPFHPVHTCVMQLRKVNHTLSSTCVIKGSSEMRIYPNPVDSRSFYVLGSVIAPIIEYSIDSGIIDRRMGQGLSAPPHIFIVTPKGVPYLLYCSDHVYPFRMFNGTDWIMLLPGLISLISPMPIGVPQRCDMLYNGSKLYLSGNLYYSPSWTPLLEYDPLTEVATHLDPPIGRVNCLVIHPLVPSKLVAIAPGRGDPEVAIYDTLTGNWSVIPAQHPPELRYHGPWDAIAVPGEPSVLIARLLPQSTEVLRLSLPDGNWTSLGTPFVRPCMDNPPRVLALQAAELCPAGCVHGDCATGFCRCTHGWMGSTCQECDAAAVCHRHGTCTDPARPCRCHAGRFGRHCHHTVAFAVALPLGALLAAAASATLIALCLSRRHALRRTSKGERRPLLAPVALGSASLEHFQMDPDAITLHEPIGQGRFGQVYRASLTGSNTPCAVKHLYVASRGGEQASRLERAQALREIHLLAALHHPNIVQMYGVITQPHGRGIDIVMEHCALGSLYDLLQRAEVELPLKERIQMALGIARGLAFLHRKNVIHRDLKSPNLLLTRAHEVKITDFGLSRTAPSPARAARGDGGTASPEIMTLLGTPAWTAPEILSGQPYNHRVDVYSFGLVLWELMSRQVPFLDYALPPSRFFSSVIEGLRPEVPPKTPPLLKTMMKLCWHSDPESRPEMEDVVVGLEAFLEGMGC